MTISSRRANVPTTPIGTGQVPIVRKRLGYNLGVARKPTLSPTKISTYLACPTKYMWTYVDPKGRIYMRAKSYFSFGSTLHNVLQRFHDSGDAGVTTIEEVQAAYEESWIDAGFASAEEMAEAFGEGREILERYVVEHKTRKTEAKTLFVEKQVRADFGDFVLMGRVDRVDEFPDGRLEIVDYKSGRDDVESADVANDLAMSVYQLLLRRQFPGRAVCATIIALRTGRSATCELSDEQIASIDEDIRQLANEILTANWEKRPIVKKPLCDRCDFLTLCSKTPGFGE